MPKKIPPRPLTMNAKLATMITKAAQLREDSYDQERADEASKAGELNFEQFYALTKYDAAARACAMQSEHELAPIVAWLLTSHWNEALEWAEATLEVK